MKLIPALVTAKIVKGGRFKMAGYSEATPCCPTTYHLTTKPLTLPKSCDSDPRLGYRPPSSRQKKQLTDKGMNMTELYLY